MRKRIVAGNWKMNKTPQEAKALIETLKAAGWPGSKMSRWYFARRLFL